MFNLCFHKWTKWEKYYSTYKLYPRFLATEGICRKILDGRDLREKRHCIKCGKNSKCVFRVIYIGPIQ